MLLPEEEPTSPMKGPSNTLNLMGRGQAHDVRSSTFLMDEQITPFDDAAITVTPMHNPNKEAELTEQNDVLSTTTDPSITVGKLRRMHTQAAIPAVPNKWPAKRNNVLSIAPSHLT